MKKLNNIPLGIRLKYGYYQFFDHFLGRKRFFKWTKKSRTKLNITSESFLDGLTDEDYNFPRQARARAGKYNFKTAGQNRQGYNQKE